MKVSHTLIHIFISTSIFLLSLLIAPLYVNGDQELYRIVYKNIADLSLFTAFINYKLTLGSGEVIHFIFIWIFSHLGIDKDVIMSLFNAFLAYASLQLLQRWKASIFIAVLLVLTNFYFMILYFAAERLKFGILFLILSLLYFNRTKLFVVIAIFSHFQVIIMYVAITFNSFVKQILKIFQKKTLSKSALIMILISILAISVIYQPLMGKFQSYYKGLDFSELVKTLVFLFLALFYSQNKKETFFVFVPLLIAALIVGGERINIFAYFVFLYYALPIRNGFNIGVIGTGIYFAVKSIEFFNNIYEKGSGY